MRARMTLLAAALLTALLLSACALPQSEEPSPAPTVTIEPSPEIPEPEVRQITPLSPEESQAMAMVLNANRVLVEGNNLFCYDFDENWQPVLARYRLKNGTPGKYAVLAEGCVPEYLCKDKDWLYYIDRRSGALERIPNSGGARSTLHPGPCRWLCLREGLLYFCDEAGRFVSLDPETMAITERLSGPCAFAYPLEGGVLWQEKDSGALCFTDTETGGTRVLCSGPASAPLLLGERLWYRSGNAVYGLDLAGGKTRHYDLPETDGAVELLPLDGELYLRGIREDKGPDQWEGMAHGPFKYLNRGYRICDWLGAGLRVDTVYEPDGRIRCYLLQDAEGNELRFLAGQLK